MRPRRKWETCLARPRNWRPCSSSPEHARSSRLLKCSHFLFEESIMRYEFVRDIGCATKKGTTDRFLQGQQFDEDSTEIEPGTIQALIRTGNVRPVLTPLPPKPE